MNITTRQCTEKDIDPVLPLVAAYHQFESLQTSSAHREFAVKKLLTDPKLGTIWLIYNNDHLAGYMIVCYSYSIEFGGLDAFIDEFYLLPEQRGQGIGNQALKQIKVHSQKAGVKALHLEVAKDNHRAREFYSGIGFEMRDKYSLMSLLIS